MEAAVLPVLATSDAALQLSIRIQALNIQIQVYIERNFARAHMNLKTPTPFLKCRAAR